MPLGTRAAAAAGRQRLVGGRRWGLVAGGASQARGWRLGVLAVGTHALVLESHIQGIALPPCSAPTRVAWHVRRP